MPHSSDQPGASAGAPAPESAADVPPPTKQHGCWLTLLVLWLLPMSISFAQGSLSYFFKEPAIAVRVAGLARHGTALHPRYRYRISLESDCTGLGAPFHLWLVVPHKSAVMLLSAMLGPGPHAYKGPLPDAAEMPALVARSHDLGDAQALARCSAASRDFLYLQLHAERPVELTGLGLNPAGEPRRFLELEGGGLLLLCGREGPGSIVLLVDSATRQHIQTYRLSGTACDILP